MKEIGASEYENGKTGGGPVYREREGETEELTTKRCEGKSQLTGRGKKGNPTRG